MRPALPPLPTSVVGSLPQPDWLVDRDRLGHQFPPSPRGEALARIGDLDYENLELPGDDSQALVSYTAAPGSTSQQVLQFLASWAASTEPAAPSDRASEDRPA